MSIKRAVLLTCHNRKEVTRKCLSRLRDINIGADIYCVDDASTDGTPQMIESEFPEVRLIQGDGNLFWCRGMRKAWEEALASGVRYDRFYWLNDDLLLNDNAFEELDECCTLTADKAVVTGLVCESTTGEVIYGGSWNKKLISANGKMNPVNGLNGNFVAVPSAIVDKIGIFDKVYHHDLGDVDYGLTALENGFDVVTSRCYIGKTDAGLKSPHKRNRRWGVGISKRFRILFSPLGSNPNITFHFMNKHRGLPGAMLYYLYVMFINILPDRLYKYIQR